MGKRPKPPPPPPPPPAPPPPPTPIARRPIKQASAKTKVRSPQQVARSFFGGAKKNSGKKKAMFNGLGSGL
jgi:hypothetical protein